MLATTDSATTRGPRLSARRRRFGLALMVVGALGWLGWVAWRVMTLAPNPIPVLALAIELGGAAIGVVIAYALAKVEHPRTSFQDDRRDPWRYAFAVADRVERTRAVDLHREVRSAAKRDRFGIESTSCGRKPGMLNNTTRSFIKAVPYLAANLRKRHHCPRCTARRGSPL